jgi:hypothetical protein
MVSLPRQTFYQRFNVLAGSIIFFNLSLLREGFYRIEIVCGWLRFPMLTEFSLSGMLNSGN